MTHYSVMINGLPVEAEYTEDNIKELFFPLLQRLTELQREKGKRILVFLAAPPGAGKSTLASFLRQLSLRDSTLCPITVIGIDGFHRYQDELLKRTVVREGREISMVEIKGAPETFDLPNLTQQLQLVSEGENCSWPDYSRPLHNPVENALTVEGNIVLLEGNYLLLDASGWSDLRTFADYTVSICAEESFLRARLLERKMQSGTEYAKAAEFVDFSDMANARLCLSKTLPADLELELLPDGSYHKLPDGRDKL